MQSLTKLSCFMAAVAPLCLALNTPTLIDNSTILSEKELTKQYHGPKIQFIIETEFSKSGWYWDKYIHLIEPEQATTEFQCSKEAKSRNNAAVWQDHFIGGTGFNLKIHPGNWCKFVGKWWGPSQHCRYCWDQLWIQLDDGSDFNMHKQDCLGDMCLNVPTDCVLDGPEKETDADGARAMARRRNITCTWQEGGVGAPVDTKPKPTVTHDHEHDPPHLPPVSEEQLSKVIEDMINPPERTPPPAPES